LSLFISSGSIIFEISETCPFLFPRILLHSSCLFHNNTSQEENFNIFY
jgi:hypothetical protein